jgi:hypothetical protein
VTGESKFSVAPPVSRAACSGPPGPPPALGKSFRYSYELWGPAGWLIGLWPWSRIQI